MLVPNSVRSRSIFFDPTDLDRPKTKPTRPRSIFDLNRPYIKVPTLLSKRYSRNSLIYSYLLVFQLGLNNQGKIT